MVVPTSNGKAWTLPPALESSPPETLVSFVAIQQLQLDQGTHSGKHKRSLREIQEEEYARQAEENFLKWWTAEEERVKMQNSITPFL